MKHYYYIDSNGNEVKVDKDVKGAAAVAISCPAQDDSDLPYMVSEGDSGGSDSDDMGEEEVNNDEIHFSLLYY